MSHTKCYEVDVQVQPEHTGLPYIIRVRATTDSTVLAVAGVRPNGSWDYIRRRNLTGDDLPDNPMQRAINQRVGELLDGRYRGKPEWLRGLPLGPWLSHPRQQVELEHLKRTEGWIPAEQLSPPPPAAENDTVIIDFPTAPQANLDPPPGTP